MYAGSRQKVASDVFVWSGPLDGQISTLRQGSNVISLWAIAPSIQLHGVSKAGNWETRGPGKQCWALFVARGDLHTPGQGLPDAEHYANSESADLDEPRPLGVM